MGKTAALKPHSSGGKFVLNLPASISPTGKRQRRFFDTKKEADEFVEDHQKKQKASLAVARRAEPDLIRHAVELDEVFRDIYGFPGGLREAAAEFQRRLDAENAQPTFANLLESFEKDHAAGWSGGSQDRQDWLKKQVAGLNVPSSQLFRPEFWSEWMNQKALERNWSDGSFNSAASMLSSIFEYGVKRAVIQFNPIKGVKRRRIRQKAAVVHDPEEVKRLLLAAWTNDFDMVPYFAIAEFAGLRPDDDSEIAHLWWEDINWEEDWIRVCERHDGKTEDAKRHVDLEPNLKTWLEPFKNRKGPVVPVNLRNRRQDVIKLAGVRWGVEFRDITRHTYGSNLEAKCRAAGVDAYSSICANMGHTSPSTFRRHYRNSRTKAQAKEFWAITAPVDVEPVIIEPSKRTWAVSQTRRKTLNKARAEKAT